MRRGAISLAQKGLTAITLGLEGEETCEEILIAGDSARTGMKIRWGGGEKDLGRSRGGGS